MIEDEMNEKLRVVNAGLDAIKQTLDEIGAPVEDQHVKLNLHERLVGWLVGHREPGHTGASESGLVRHVPMRGSDVEAWVKRARDAHAVRSCEQSEWRAIDDLLEDYRLHADTGTLLDEDVTEP